MLTKYINRGFIALDKPAGPTSHDVVATVKKILDIDKAGHAGTLDPGVSGVLPVGIEESTKILSVLSGAKKRYICNLYLNQEVEKERVEKVLNELSGQIYQFPPLKSNVAMRLRKRTIYKINLLETKDNEYLLDIICEAGTYIRTLCIDIGRILGVQGKMKELRRIESSIFTEDDTITLHDLYDSYQDAVENLGEEKIRQVIQPLEEVLGEIPGVIIQNNAVTSISHGAKLAIPGIVAYQEFSRGDEVRILTCKGELVALGEAMIPSSAIQTKEKGFVLQPKRVIFDRDEYLMET